MGGQRRAFFRFSATASTPVVYIDVTDLTELNAALATASGGEVIRLASGNYGDLSLSNKSFGGTVTIRSADGAGGGVFHSITINTVDFISFDTITVERPLEAGEPNYIYAVFISNSSNVAISNSEIFGSVDEDYENDPNGNLPQSDARCYRGQ